MCGIAGAVLPPGETVEPAVVGRFLDGLLHRGPDDGGWLSLSTSGVARGRDPGLCPAGQVALVNRRLAILDLSVDGWQPMSTPDGRYHIAYNGELYNYLELRAELEAEGVLFTSRSDTEVLLAAVSRWGPYALERFVGMFAFALLDVEARKLLLARDPFGIKPLYYTRWRGGVAFASELPALLDLPGVERTIDPESLYQYLRWGITDYDSATLLESVRQVPAAHFVEISLDRPGARPRPAPYWSIDPHERLDLSFEEAAERLREMFLQSIRLHLRSDVPVGVACSGGIDSSSILASMRHVGGKDLEIHAFSYIAEGKDISEERWVDLVGCEVEATVHKVRATPDELLRDLDRLLLAQGEPFTSTSIYAQYRVFQLAHENGVKVMLDGQGADEILAGYRPFLAARLASCVRSVDIPGAAAVVRSIARTPPSEAARAFAEAGGHLLPRRLQGAARTAVGAGLQPRWLNRRWFEDRQAPTQPFLPFRESDVLRASLRQNVLRTSLPSLLRYEDRNSMAHSVESRVPFLTPAIVQFCLSLPEEFLMASDGTSKAVFRRAMRGIVPDPILDRRDKVGFATPELQWLKALRPWVFATLEGPSAERVHALDRREALVEWRAILEGSRRFDSRAWRWLNLIRWADLLDVSFE